MSDLISRQDAVDIINGYEEQFNGYIGTPNDSEVYAYARGLLLSIERNISALPSAQPEIIICKDCKYRMPYDWMFSETWRSRNIDDYSEDEIGCKYCDMTMKADDFCSKGERRTDEMQ